MSVKQMMSGGKPWALVRIRTAGSAPLAAAVALCAGLSTGGCSMSFPIAGFASDPTPTGSINSPDTLLSHDLDQEDWRRAKAALAVSLDPQGNGALATWANPATGSKGSFAATSPPRPEHDAICRAFRSEVAPYGNPPRLIEGSACRDSGGDWRIAKAYEHKKATS